MRHRPNAVEAESFIRGELTRLGIRYRESHDHFRLVCPRPHGNGENRKFNLGIKKDGSTSSCFVCKQTGHWDMIAPLLGASKFGQSGIVTEQSLSFDILAALQKRLADVALSDDEDDDITDQLSPWSGAWRGMDESFLQKMGAQRWMHQPSATVAVPRIWFPCMQFGQYLGYVSRRLDKSPVARYYNAPWMHSTDVLFPFDRTRELGHSTVVIVEGPVDALKLLSYGIPALSMLGSNNFGTKESLLLSAGYKKALLFMDADKAGRKATPAIYTRLRKVMDTVLITGLEEGQDPGILTQEQSYAILSKYF